MGLNEKSPSLNREAGVDKTCDIVRMGRRHGAYPRPLVRDGILRDYQHQEERMFNCVYPRVHY